MRPILSDNGSIELMFGSAALAGAYLSGAPAFEAGMLAAIGIGFTVSGIGLRVDYKAKLRQDMQRMDSERLKP
jgi:hypothetical protein